MSDPTQASPAPTPAPSAAPAASPSPAPASAADVETLNQILSQLAADHAAVVEKVTEFDAHIKNLNDFMARLKQGLPIT